MVGLNVYGSDQLMPEDREAIAAYLKPVPLIGEWHPKKKRQSRAAEDFAYMLMTALRPDAN